MAILIGTHSTSTTSRCLRPSVFLPAPQPAGLPLSVVSADWASTEAAVSERPAMSRPRARSVSIIRSQPPSRLHAWKWC